jgi:hypothetical protein
MQQSSASKGLLIGIAALVVIALAGFAYLRMSGTSVSGTDVATAAPSSMEEKGMSLKDLLEKTAPTRCTVTSSNDRVRSDGVVYIAGGKMRSDFTSTVTSGPGTGQVMVAHMIIDADMSYMWGDNPEMKMGIKMARKEMMDVAPEKGMNAPANQAALDMNEKSDYSCEGWTLDASRFVPPSDIQFADMSDMKGMMPASPTSVPSGASARTPQGSATGITDEQKAAMCGACDQAGAGRDQCRAALGCK